MCGKVKIVKIKYNLSTEQAFISAGLGSFRSSMYVREIHDELKTSNKSAVYTGCYEGCTDNREQILRQLQF
jgi:hypothetical protein